MAEGSTTKVWVLAGLSELLAQTVEQQLTKLGQRVICATPGPAQTTWDNLFAAVDAKIGPPDVLILGLPAATDSPLEDMTLERFRQDNEANLVGSFLGVQAAFKAFAGRGGRIVTLGSASARAGKGSSPTLCAASGGLAMLTRASALEGAGQTPHIHVNGVLADGAALWPAASGDSKASLEEIAQALIFLGGPGADYMTGSLVPIGAPGP